MTPLDSDGTPGVVDEPGDQVKRFHMGILKQPNDWPAFYVFLIIHKY